MCNRVIGAQGSVIWLWGLKLVCEVKFQSILLKILMLAMMKKVLGSQGSQPTAHFSEEKKNPKNQLVITLTIIHWSANNGPYEYYNWSEDVLEEGDLVGWLKNQISVIKHM